MVTAAYAQQPTLRVTTQQAQRLWSLDRPTCGYLLDSLVSAGLLSRTSAGQYCRADYVNPIDPAASM